MRFSFRAHLHFSDQVIFHVYWWCQKSVQNHWITYTLRTSIQTIVQILCTVNWYGHAWPFGAKPTVCSVVFKNGATLCSMMKARTFSTEFKSVILRQFLQRLRSPFLGIGIMGPSFQSLAIFLVFHISRRSDLKTGATFSAPYINSSGKNANCNGSFVEFQTCWSQLWSSVGVVSPANLTLILSIDYLSSFIWTLIVLLPFSNLFIHCKAITAILVL